LGIRSATCKLCHNREYGQAWYVANRDKVIESTANRRRRYKEEVKEWVMGYLATHPCVDCGETELSVLEFDHLDPSMKTIEVGKLIHGGVLAEQGAKRGVKVRGPLRELSPQEDSPRSRMVQEVTHEMPTLPKRKGSPRVSVEK